MIEPHGGKLVDCRLPAPDVDEYRTRLAGLPKIHLNAFGLSDLEMLGTGAFSPLTGFMTRSDYQNVLQELRLASGLVWSIPITLSIDGAKKAELRHHDSAVLIDPAGRAAGLLEIGDIWKSDKMAEARKVYGTEDPGHPGVIRLISQQEFLIGGMVRLFESVPANRFQSHRFTPEDTRKMFAARGWKSVTAFQTRNPIHRAHEYIQKCALEITDGLLIHPLTGETTGDDVPADVRMQTYEILLRHYFPKNRVILSVFPAAMRYAGPREAIFHALVRKNYGCTHFIVGRDHAGYKNFYGTYEAQKIFDRFSTEELGITPLFFEHTFFCRRCNGMASAKTCPHPEDDHIVLSGTKVRRMLRAGALPPPEVTRPEVAKILARLSEE